VISGALVTAVLMFGVQVWRYVWLSWPVAGLVWALVTVVIWGLSTWRGLFWWLERATGQDIDEDGYIGSPDRLILVNPPRTQADPRERKRAQFVDFVKGCAAGDTSLRRWEPALGRDRYQEYRDALIDTTWGRWIDDSNKRRGWELAAEPGEIIAALG